LGEAGSQHERRSVLVIAGEPMVRELLLRALEQRGVEAVGAGAGDAMRTFRAVDPDVVVIDASFGAGLSDCDLAAAMLEEEPTTAIVFLADACIGAAQVPDIDALVTAMDATMSGRPTAAPLSRRQVEVLRLVALGKTDAQIAVMRGTTLEAAERTVARAFASLGVEGKPDAHERVRLAQRSIVRARPKV
jgi:DNA-binding NarL/FixJ family response regulator